MNEILKRAFDLVLSILFLVITFPFLVLIALAIKVDSPGPVLFGGRRVGKDGVEFEILKFRTMVDRAEVMGPAVTRENDSRVTRVGVFLRNYKLDEIPQLLNVLRGEMSLVGPRPERPVYVNQFRRSIPRYMDRHWEKAGMTGWAQVNGLRGDTSIVERTRYDLWYIENWSLLLDIKILIWTFFNLVTSPNAY